MNDSHQQSTHINIIIPSGKAQMVRFAFHKFQLFNQVRADSGSNKRSFLQLGWLYLRPYGNDSIFAPV